MKRFELHSHLNAPEDTELLRYVTYTIYNNEFDVHNEPSIEQKEYADRCLLMFKKRYSEDLIDEPCSYEEFMGKREIVETLDALNLDHDRFWFLFLYIFDYTMGKFVEGLKTKPSGMEQVNSYINSLNEICLDKYDELSGAYFSKKVELELKFNTKGKSKVVIDNQYVLFLIKRILELNHELLENDRNMHFRNLKSWKSDVSSRSVHIISFYNMFNNALRDVSKLKELNIYADEKPLTSDQKVNKILFISRLIYIAGLSDNKKFYEDDDPIKGFFGQYKDYKDNHVNGYY